MLKLVALTSLFDNVFAQDIFLARKPENSLPSRIGNVRGAALNGLLQWEDWFFSWPQGLPPVVPYPFDEVSSGPRLPQGRRFPSDVVAPELVDPWFSEGGVVGTTASRIGDSATIAAVTVHRESYITEYDFKHMADHGVTHVRLAFGWWVFAENPSTVIKPTLINDPCYPDYRFVTVPGSFLTTLLEQASRYNVSVLFDLHAMPCGSSDGTYNGVFPEDPAFFRNETAKEIGLKAVRNMMHWWKELPRELQRAVHGFTVLNEPGLGLVIGGSGGGAHLRPGVTPLPGGNASIVAFLQDAVDIFTESITDLALHQDVPPPMLYMNLHESAFPVMENNVSSIEQMASVYAGLGLAGKKYAVYDVHHYFSWGGKGNGIPAENCSTDDELKAYVQEGMDEFTNAMTTAAAKYEIVNIGCSEWSLSLHHKDHISPCTAPNSLSIMHDVQVNAFKEANMAQFFWGWRMPTGGTHEAMWSLKYHYTGLH